jgi:N utilization substance protein B
MAKRKEPNPRAASRSAARLAAVQALYQMDMTGIDLNQVIAEFEVHRLGQELEGCQYGQLTIDPLIDKQLAEGWRLTRVDSILRAILRAGAYEILERSDIPARVVISEYVDIAHAFFAEEEPKVVNGILDRIGHKARPQEFASEGTGDA